MFKKYLLPVLLMMLMSASTFILVITRMSPCREYGSTQICSQISPINHIFLYLSLTIFIACFFASLTFFLRAKKAPEEKHAHYFNTSLRQGILISIFSSVSIFFLSLNILKWWTSLILLILIILIEFISLQKRQI